MAPHQEKNHIWALGKMGVPYTLIELIAHEDAISSKVYRIDERAVLKLCYNTDRHRKEKHYLERLQDVIPVPRVLTTLDPEPGFHGALLLEYVPGAILKPETLTDKEAFELGAILAQLHSIPVDSFGDLSLPLAKRKKSRPIDLMRNYLEESLSECKDHVPSDLLRRCTLYAERHLSTLLEAEGPCIIHRDYRPGNALGHEGKVRAIIDFELANGSFAEEDFAQIEMLCFNRAPHTKIPFLKGYASIRPLPQSLDEITPLLCLLKSLGALGFTFERGTWQGEHAHIYESNLTFITRFLSDDGGVSW